MVPLGGSPPQPQEPAPKRGSKMSREEVFEKIVQLLKNQGAQKSLSAVLTQEEKKKCCSFPLKNKEAEPAIKGTLPLE